ncbi:ChbG/HpnK family deacetylase, partial [uncultured Caballeronia sp.]|uniref:ChbG/HpnK family deacetylase n=1 Tax=uncultured Caballeronia sp. TaxID=1827198 RepID=UPI0035CC90EF
FGLTRGINRAIAELHAAGALTSATLMANGPAFDDAVAIAHAHPGLGVGCHVVLTDGTPVSHPHSIPSLMGADGKTLRETVDKLKDKLKNAAIVLAAVDGNKVSLIAGVTAEASKKVKAGDLVNFVAQQVGGKGGGRPDMAQAGGTEPQNLAAALAGVNEWVKGKL